MRFIGSYTVNSLVQEECHQLPMLGILEKSLHLGNVIEYVTGNASYILSGMHNRKTGCKLRPSRARDNPFLTVRTEQSLWHGRRYLDTNIGSADMPFDSFIDNKSMARKIRKLPALDIISFHWNPSASHSFSPRR